MLPGFLLPQRAQAIGLPVFAAALLLLLTGYPKDRARIVFLGVLTGLSPVFNYYASVSCAVAVLLYAVFSYRAASLRKDVNALACIFVPCAVLAIPFAYDALSASCGMFAWTFGWLAPKDGAASFIAFYAANLGLTAMLALLSIPIAGMQRKGFLWGLCYYPVFIPKLVHVLQSALGDGEVFSFLMVPLSVLAGAAVAKLPEYLWPVILFFCCIPALTGLFSTYPAGGLGSTMQNLQQGNGLWRIHLKGLYLLHRLLITAL